MRKLAIYEGVVENGHLTLPPDAHIPERTRVYVLVPDADAQRTHYMATLVPRTSVDELNLGIDQAGDYELEGFDGRRTMAQAVKLDLIFHRASFQSQVRDH